jgi:hypothetical protein
MLLPNMKVFPQKSAIFSVACRIYVARTTDSSAASISALSSSRGNK